MSPRNYVALAAWVKGGAGKHEDRRTRRRRTRGARKRQAIKDQRA